jgi:hypothetical protein
MLEALALISVSDPDSQCNTPGPIYLILGRSILGMAVGTLGELLTAINTSLFLRSMQYCNHMAVQCCACCTATASDAASLLLQLLSI